LIATLLGRQGMAHARAFAGNVGIAAIADRLLRNGDPLVVSWNLTCPLYSFSSAESADVCVRGCLASHIFGGTCICGLWHTYTRCLGISGFGKVRTEVLKTITGTEPA
jgi:hypothetical protein